MGRREVGRVDELLNFYKLKTEKKILSSLLQNKQGLFSVGHSK